jgi:hypothetical protein
VRLILGQLHASWPLSPSVWHFRLSLAPRLPSRRGAFSVLPHIWCSRPTPALEWALRPYNKQGWYASRKGSTPQHQKCGRTAFSCAAGGTRERRPLLTPDRRGRRHPVPRAGYAQKEPPRETPSRPGVRKDALFRYRPHSRHGSTKSPAVGTDHGVSQQGPSQPDCQGCPSKGPIVVIGTPAAKLETKRPPVSCRGTQAALGCAGGDSTGPKP